MVRGADFGHLAVLLAFVGIPGAQTPGDALNPPNISKDFAHLNRTGGLSMAKERSVAADVIAQEGERVEVEHRGERLTVPMRGFPPGFKLRPRSRVILSDEPSGTVARPLVRAVRRKLPKEDVENRRTLDVEGRRLELQEATVLEALAPDGQSQDGNEYEIWIVEHGEGDPVEQVIAARRRQEDRSR